MAPKRKMAPPDFWKKSNTERAVFLLTEAQQDCCFVFESTEPGLPIKRLYSYKWFLASFSPLFRTMFNGNFKESTVSSMDIKIDDISFEDFNIFLELINHSGYPDQWPDSCWDGLLYTLDKYMMPNLIKQLRPSVDNTKDPITIFKWNKVEKRDDFKISFQEKILLDPRLGQIDVQTFIDFMTTLNFTEPSNNRFNHFNQFRLIEAYINAKGYNIDMNESTPVVRIQNDTDGKNYTIIKSHREIVEDLLKFVQFQLMSVKEFLDGPYDSNLLSSERKLYILQKILKRLKLHQTH